MKRFMLVVVGAAFLGAGCVAIPAPRASSGDPDCPVGVDHLRGQRPDIFISVVECGDYGTGFNGYYDAPADKVLINAHWEYADAEWYRSLTAHELGHAWYVKRLDVAARNRYPQIRGGAEPAHGWFEDYGDVYALVVGKATRVGYGTPYPPAEQEAVICGERLMPCG